MTVAQELPDTFGHSTLQTVQRWDPFKLFSAVGAWA
jgi:hypothetical protein